MDELKFWKNQMKEFGYFGDKQKPINVELYKEAKHRYDILSAPEPSVDKPQSVKTKAKRSKKKAK